MTKSNDVSSRAKRDALDCGHILNSHCSAEVTNTG